LDAGLAHNQSDQRQRSRDDRHPSVVPAASKSELEAASKTALDKLAGAQQYGWTAPACTARHSASGCWPIRCSATT